MRPLTVTASLFAPFCARDVTYDHAIVALGCPTEADGSPSPNLLRRLQATLEAALTAPKALIIVTGGGVEGPAEGPAMRDWLVDQGLDPARIWVESKARYTLDNAEKVAPWLVAANVSRVTVVTEQFHLQRGQTLVEGAIRRLGLSANVDGVAAPDGLTEQEAADMAAVERFKLQRDLSTLEAKPKHGLFFNARLFSRQAMAAV